MVRHLPQPPAVQRRHVIVQQTKQLARGMARGKIVRRRVIEARCVMHQNPHPPVTLQPRTRLLLHYIQRLGLRDHHNEFQPRIRGPAEQRRQAAANSAPPQRRGDQHTDPSRLAASPRQRVRRQHRGIVATMRQQLRHMLDDQSGIHHPQCGIHAQRFGPARTTRVQPLRSDQPHTARHCARRNAQPGRLCFEVGAYPPPRAIQMILVGEQHGRAPFRGLTQHGQRMRSRQLSGLKQRNVIAHQHRPRLVRPYAHHRDPQHRPVQRPQRRPPRRVVPIVHHQGDHAWHIPRNRRVPVRIEQRGPASVLRPATLGQDHPRQLGARREQETGRVSHCHPRQRRGSRPRSPNTPQQHGLRPCQRGTSQHRQAIDDAKPLQPERLGLRRKISDPPRLQQHLRQRCPRPGSLYRQRGQTALARPNHHPPPAQFRRNARPKYPVRRGRERNLLRAVPRRRPRAEREPCDPGEHHPNASDCD